MTARRAAPWAALPLLLGAHWMFMLARHEGAHALVAVFTGARVVDIHLWPPAGGSLSWVTAIPLRPRSPAEVQLQALAPYAASLAMVIATLHGLSRRPGRWGFARVNLALGGLAFPLLDLALGVVAYWLAPSDLRLAFGSAAPGVGIAISLWLAALGALSLALVAVQARR